ncbi:FxsA family protein [Modicisalibacter zincidurans]|uniref:Membrane protein FxsA n=1 Tax=Modicisalibacter zincidurans TaxID=1178777 RepID=A0ABP9QYE4_9GAMM|nr:FxsA family protein [Halomonas zincidurans]|tara:strand:+ start:144 stop:656 length:513 start_codon:yes stop_codon:yes gene_type:complete
MPILLFFTLFALLDFAILFSVGSQIGLLTTLVLVIGTGFLGLHLVKREGVSTLQRAQQRFAQGEIPSDELMTGAALIFGGALLMAPGFLSDALGFMCLLPNSRRLLGRLLKKLPGRMSVYSMHSRYRPGNTGWSEDVSPTSDSSDASEEMTSRSNDPLEGDFLGRDETRR